MNIASIDIGSNTILLLIAEVNLSTNEVIPILNRYEVPRISGGLEVSRLISDKKVDELEEIMADYLNLAKQFNCEHVLVNATNAFRIANNSADICKRIKAAFKIDINIISGEREAYLSFLGAKSSFQQFQNMIVLDIGGGSTEVIVGNNSEIKYRNSFPVGAVNLTEKYISEYPVKISELNNLSAFVKSIFDPISSFAKQSVPLVALAGTPTSLSSIIQKLDEYNDNLVEGSVIRKFEISFLIEEMKKLNPAKILTKYGSVVLGREDVLLTGSIILSEVMKLLGLNETFVSSRGLRYGVIIDFITNLQ